MCSGSEAGSYLRLIDCAHHSTVALTEIKKRRDLGIGSEAGARGLSLFARVEVPSIRERVHPSRQCHLQRERGITGIQDYRGSKVED
jgi:hypothetical protein